MKGLHQIKITTTTIYIIYIQIIYYIFYRKRKYSESAIFKSLISTIHQPVTDIPMPRYPRPVPRTPVYNVRSNTHTRVHSLAVM